MSCAPILSAVLLALAAPAAFAGLVTKAFAGTIAIADPIFGSKGPGSTFEGSFTYENDPALNPDLLGGAALPGTAVFRWTSFTIEATSFAHSEGSGLGRQQGILLINDITGAVPRDQIQVEGLLGSTVYTLSIRGSTSAYSNVAQVSAIDALTGASFSPAPPGLVVGPIRLNETGAPDLNTGPIFVFAGVPIASAVPEPPALALIGLGVVTLVGLRRRHWSPPQAGSSKRRRSEAQRRGSGRADDRQPMAGPVSGSRPAERRTCAGFDSRALPSRTSALLSLG